MMGVTPIGGGRRCVLAATAHCGLHCLDRGDQGCAEALAAALVNRGAAYWYMNKIPQALADLDRAIALDPKNARAFRERSNSQRSAGRIDLALADANEAVRLDPDDAKAFDNRGNVFNNNGQYDRAIEDYNEAIRLDPRSSLAFMDRGAAYYFKMDYERAIATTMRPSGSIPRRPRLHQSRRGLQEARPHRAGIADESEAIKLDPSVPEYFDNRGLSYAGKRRLRPRHPSTTTKRSASRRRRISSTNRGDSYQHKGDIRTAPSPTTTARSSSIRDSTRPTIIVAPLFSKKGDIDRAMRGLTAERCASIRDSTPPRKIS